jgi:hypothetical protein
MIEPTIVGDKLNWTDGVHKWTLTGVPVIVPGPVDPPPPPPEPPTPTGAGIWLSRAEIERLPTSGAAWDAMLAAANKAITSPNLNDQDSPNNVITLAKALVYARTGEAKYRDEVIALIGNLPEPGDRTLALGRELAAYVVAADLVGIPPSQLEGKLRAIITKKLSDGRTLIETHKMRPNNWGTFAGASIAAVAAYLGDKALLSSTALVFRGWLGDRSAYSGFKFGDLSWQANPAAPVAVGLPGDTKDGHSLSGCLGEEMRRGGGFKWPPPNQNYVWGALSGAVEQAMFLHRAGYPAFEWMQGGIFRAMQFMRNHGYKAEGDDAWMVPVVNKAYNLTGDSAFTAVGIGAGKGMAWTPWSHQ